MFSPISIDKVIEMSVKSNPGTSKKELKSSLMESVDLKLTGAKCDVCGSSIWAIGTSIVGRLIYSIKNIRNSCKNI